MQTNLKTVYFLGVKVTLIGVKGLIDYMVAETRQHKPRLINNVNVHAYYLTFFDADFKNNLNASDIVFCDGFGVKLGAKMFGIRLGERMTPPDWIDELFARCQSDSVSIFFLGDEEKVVNLFAEKVKASYPNLKIAGFHHGFFNKHNEENEEVVALINRSKADIVITGMGMPLQEKWALENKERLQAKAILGTGALFRWYTNFEKRGPRIFTDNGFEWLWRLFVQPRKVWRRYIIELPYFFGVVLKRWLQTKIKNTPL